jgi:NitT/TauT family transport system permease protein
MTAFMNVRKQRLTFYKLLPLIIFLLVWEVLVRSNSELVFFFGTPSKITDYLISKTIDGSLPVDFLVTFTEAFTGFIIGNLLGTLIGLSLWYSRTVFLISRPYITALGSAPIFALAPLLIIWFGTGMYSKIMIATLSTVFIALFQAYTGASEVSNDYIRLMRTFGASKHDIFCKVIAPSAVVWVISAFKMNVGFALLGAFIGEFISSNQGLGHLILVASGLFDISLVLCGVLLLVCIALIFNFIIEKIELPLKHLIVKYI